MDKKYIKMCEKAEEIHKRFLEEGDYYCWVELQHKIFLWKGDSSIRTKDRIWLPRQDQLQDMVWPPITEDTVHHNRMFHYLWKPFYDYFTEDQAYHGGMSKEQTNYCEGFSSMEQLWLAFVMHQKKKVWNGEDWLDSSKICPRCKGEGFIEVYVRKGDDADVDHDHCPKCKGTGVV